MELTITGTISNEIVLFPSTLQEEIIQNIRHIISTPIFSVPLDRRFGLNSTLIDSPMPQAMAKLSNQILNKISEYEPRVKVTRITYTGEGMEGVLLPKVQVVIIE